MSNGVDPHGRHQVDNQPVDEPLVAFEEEYKHDYCHARHQSRSGQRELNDECSIFCTVGQVVAAPRGIACVGEVLHR